MGGIVQERAAKDPRAMISRGNEYWEWPATIDCSRCNGKGYIAGTVLVHEAERTLCPNCVGVAITAIPWEELFKAGRGYWHVWEG